MTLCRELIDQKLIKKMHFNQRTCFENYHTISDHFLQRKDKKICKHFFFLLRTVFKMRRIIETQLYLIMWQTWPCFDPLKYTFLSFILKTLALLPGNRLTASWSWTQSDQLSHVPVTNSSPLQLTVLFLKPQTKTNLSFHSLVLSGI